MADPVPIVRTFMSSPEVTCSWTCLKAFKFDVPWRSAGDRARAELRLDAAGDPGFEKNATKIPTSSESTRQVITMTDCKNLLGRLDDTIEEGKAFSRHSGASPTTPPWGGCDRSSWCLVNRSMKLTSKLPLLTRCIAVCSESKKHD